MQLPDGVLETVDVLFVLLVGLNKQPYFVLFVLKKVIGLLILLPEQFFKIFNLLLGSRHFFLEVADFLILFLDGFLVVLNLGGCLGLEQLYLL